MSGAPGGQRVGVQGSPCPKSLVAMGMGMSVWGWGYPSLGWRVPLGWSLGSQAGGRGMPACWQHILDPVLCCPLAGVPLFHPSRVRQLEEELRTMDQTLKSLIASEEEVLGQGRGATHSSPPFSVAVSQTVRATSLLSAPLPPPPTSPRLLLRRVQAGHAPPSLRACSLSRRGWQEPSWWRCTGHPCEEARGTDEWMCPGSSRLQRLCSFSTCTEFSLLSTCSLSFFPPSPRPLFLLPTLSCPLVPLPLLAAPAWDVVNVVT